MTDNEKLVVKCNICNDILSDNVKKFQTCSCGKVSVDTVKYPYYRIIGNKESYTILKGTNIFEYNNF